MKIILQRVKKAHVSVENKIVGKINKGYLIFFGVGADDTKEDCDRLAKRISGLRIFSDENDKINLSLKDVNGEVLVVSQFTLYADCKKGNRPNFIKAGSPEKANKLYEYFVLKMKEYVPCVQTGVFGADMDVSIINDGPFTLILE